MHSRHRSWLTLPRLALLASLLGALAAPAAALPALLEQAKRDGVVGEQADGYLGLVKGSAPADVKSAMNDVNTGRRVEYERRAKDQGVDTKAYAAVAGQKLVDREPSGHHVRGADGRWAKKP
jgi:uncharacterized protein YdbL (DUF1318 family)